MKRKKLTAVATVMAVSAMAGQAWAETVCASAQDLTALQVASVQQELAVAALACENDDVSLYNSFVTIYQPELITSDEALLAYFMRRAPASGTDDYHSFKTKLANQYSVRSSGNHGSFCGKAEALFKDALAGRKKSLAAFALAQPMVVDASYTICGDTVKGESFASAIKDEPKEEKPAAPQPVLAAAPPPAPEPARAAVLPDARSYGYSVRPAVQSTCSRMTSGYLDCFYGAFHYYRDPYGRFLPPPAVYPRSF
ncbi:MAG TPA: hypothetical protein VFW28_12280 [Micropepsaceae bacterium]|nr:hypothetical protein [Micropepsaceae bacterium]